MYRYYNGNGWSNLVNKAYLENYYKVNCSDYGSSFEDWMADMLKCDLIRHYGRF